MSERAVSDVVSYVLVFGLVISAVGVVSVSGLATLQDTRDDEQINNAERAFSVLADNMADVYQRDAPSRATEISLSEAQLATGENVTISVDVTDSGGTESVGSWETRPIVYTGSDDRKLAYEGGAVFRKGGSGGLVVEQPPFVITENRVLIPVIGLTRSDRQALSGSTVLVRGNKQETDVAFNSATDDVDRITVEISGSPRQGLWIDYFEGKEAVDSCSTGSGSVTCTIDPSGSATIDQVYIVHHDIAVDIDS